MGFTKILIVDDHPALRHGISQLINKEKELKVTDEAGDRQEAVDAVADSPPDLVILDIGLKDTAASGLELIPEIHRAAGPIPILVYSMYDEMIYAERALRSGALGYLMKQEPVRELIVAIRTVLTGAVYVSEAVTQRLLRRHVGPPVVGKGSCFPEESLTEREFEVFHLLGRGLQPREIADTLRLSTKTIETHRMRIRTKMGLANAGELVRFAVEWVRHQEPSPTR